MPDCCRESAADSRRLVFLPAVRHTHTESMRTMCLGWAMGGKAWLHRHPEAIRGTAPSGVMEGRQGGWWNTGSFSVTAEPSRGWVGGVSCCELIAAAATCSRPQQLLCKRQTEWGAGGAACEQGEVQRGQYTRWDDAQIVTSLATLNPSNTYSRICFFHSSFVSSSADCSLYRSSLSVLTTNHHNDKSSCPQAPQGPLV